MPECQAKFCTVVRGKGISTFSIPNPQKNYELCARWIHNLGNAKLNPKTFVFSRDKIVCERHFEKDCFKEDIRVSTKYILLFFSVNINDSKCINNQCLFTTLKTLTYDHFLI